MRADSPKQAPPGAVVSLCGLATARSSFRRSQLNRRAGAYGNSELRSVGRLKGGVRETSAGARSAGAPRGGGYHTLRHEYFQFSNNFVTLKLLRNVARFRMGTRHLRHRTRGELESAAALSRVSADPSLTGLDVEMHSLARPHLRVRRGDQNGADGKTLPPRGRRGRPAQ